MRKHIEKKILPKYFAAIRNGTKTFEIRKDEDDISVGDVLVLREWDGRFYTGRVMQREVTYVLRNCPEYGLKDGYAIFGLQPRGWDGTMIATIDAEPIAKRVPKWHPCTEPPSDDRSVFIAYGSKGLKSCCIGFYEPDNRQWYEQKNFFASIIYDAKYWCDMPELPEGWYE